VGWVGEGTGQKRKGPVRSVRTTKRGKQTVSGCKMKTGKSLTKNQVDIEWEGHSEIGGERRGKEKGAFWWGSEDARGKKLLGRQAMPPTKGLVA